VRVRQLTRELDEKRLKLKPVCFLSDEWLSPGGQAAIGIPMIILALIQVILDLKGIESKADDSAAPVDFQMTRTVAPDVAFKRTVNIFTWFFGFFFGCWLVGFTITIPVIVFSYMYFHGKEKLWLAATLTVVAFIFYYSLFVRLLNLPFPDGMIQTWLGWA